LHPPNWVNPVCRKVSPFCKPKRIRREYSALQELLEKCGLIMGTASFFERLSKSIFFDCFRKFHAGEEQTYFRKNSRWPFQDDHIFVSQDLADKVEKCYVLNNDDQLKKFSDHLPVARAIGKNLFCLFPFFLVSAIISNCKSRELRNSGTVEGRRGASQTLGAFAEEVGFEPQFTSKAVRKIQLILVWN
jgi:hypothetical protein